MPRYDDKQDQTMMAIEGLMQGSTDGLIEASEARGQRDLVQSEDLPILSTPHRDLVAKHTGIVFGEPVNELFIAAQLPEGWSKQATDHSMHSDLVDEKSRRRAGIFYKAAFYDRRADMHFCPFYKIDCDWERYAVRVTNANGETLKDFGEVSAQQDEAKEGGLDKYREFENLREAAVKWLDENYPDHADPFAYWD